MNDIPVVFLQLSLVRMLPAVVVAAAVAAAVAVAVAATAFELG